MFCECNVSFRVLARQSDTNPRVMRYGPRALGVFIAVPLFILMGTFMWHAAAHNRSFPYPLMMKRILNLRPKDAAGASAVGYYTIAVVAYGGAAFVGVKFAAIRLMRKRIVIDGDTITLPRPGCGMEHCLIRRTDILQITWTLARPCETMVHTSRGVFVIDSRLLSEKDLKEVKAWLDARRSD